MNMADPTRTIPVAALDRAERIQEATARLTAVFVRHGGVLHPLGLELDEIVREFEQVAREEALEDCEAIAAEDYIRGEEIAQRIRALREGS